MPPALQLSEAEKADLIAQGRKPHWRFKLDHRVIKWTDLVRGESHIDCASLSDPVLQREDGSWLYTLPSVVDDIDLGVTSPGDSLEGTELVIAVPSLSSSELASADTLTITVQGGASASPSTSLNIVRVITGTGG